jgi:hypothetical protein
MEIDGDGSQGSRKEKECRAQGSWMQMCVRRRWGATAFVVGKGEKVADPFGAFPLCKSCCPLEFRGDQGEVERLPTPGPSSHTQ